MGKHVVTTAVGFSVIVATQIASSQGDSAVADPVASRLSPPK